MILRRLQHVVHAEQQLQPTPGRRFAGHRIQAAARFGDHAAIGPADRQREQDHRRDLEPEQQVEDHPDALRCGRGIRPAAIDRTPDRCLHFLHRPFGGGQREDADRARVIVRFIGGDGAAPPLHQRLDFAVDAGIQHIAALVDAQARHDRFDVAERGVELRDRPAVMADARDVVERILGVGQSARQIGERGGMRIEPGPLFATGVDQGVGGQLRKDDRERRQQDRSRCREPLG